MTDLGRLGDDYVAAWHADDHARIEALLAELADAELSQLLDLVESRLTGELEPDAATIDPQTLHSALRAAGATAAEALRMSQLAAHDLGAYLSACMTIDARRPAEVASAVVQQTGLDPADQPVVERYVRRITAGLHDVRRLRDGALDALASATSASREVLRGLRDAAAPVQPVGLAAARGSDDGAALELIAQQNAAPVDDLFCGREP